MAGLILSGVGRRFGSVAAVADVDLALAPGEFLAVLGPSGCGKTTLLRLIAGFERVDAGRIALDDTLLSTPDYHLPAERRGMGIVFQHYALWPHMSVARNVGYPLEVRGVPRDEQTRRAGEALARVGLAGFEGRLPAELSGGQRQRVALARCLVLQAKLVLLDEPLASLDVHLRASLQDAFADFHGESGAGMLYITHDQNEAMALADRIAVMEAGRVVQVAPPATLYRQPATAMIAGFVGKGGLVAVRVTGPAQAGRAPISLLGYPAVARCRADQPSGAALLCLRPEDLRVAAAGEPGFAATVKRTLYQGGANAVELVPEGQPEVVLLMSAPPDADFPAGKSVRLALVDGWVVPADRASARVAGENRDRDILRARARQPHRGTGAR
jgi:iron(III) transport system ATP-binding protein